MPLKRLISDGCVGFAYSGWAGGGELLPVPMPTKAGVLLDRKQSNTFFVKIA
jgi:hypothetical protein